MRISEQEVLKSESGATVHPSSSSLTRSPLGPLFPREPCSPFSPTCPYKGFLQTLTHIFVAVTVSLWVDINSIYFLATRSVRSRCALKHTHVARRYTTRLRSQSRFLPLSGALSLTSSPRSPLSPLFPAKPGSPCHNTDIYTCIIFPARRDAHRTDPSLVIVPSLCIDSP